MSPEFSATTSDYRQWLSEQKGRFRQVQIKASMAVNRDAALLLAGVDIVERQASHAWGSGFLDKLSRDLMQEFAEVKGFSKRNLEQTRRWFRFWSSDSAIAKQAATQFFGAPGTGALLEVKVLP
ncbi:MAG: DUF1016 N-terminal domain-containing protein [Lautropia sp.]|nr:DUF1016 N-terminal domain-containing protein [Lautropia sp.]